MPLKEQEKQPIWFNEGIENQIVTDLRTAYYENSGVFLQSIARQLYLDDKPAAEAMHRELSYWIDNVSNKSRV